jgi:erythromycin esterase
VLRYTLLLACAPVLAQAADEPQDYVAQRAVVVRSIDAADEDFSDLEPLTDAIGSARVVQLGEPSHKAGSSFAAKVRLIKFLHQRMGFDVLVWESGMYGLRLAQAGMRGSEDAVDAARRGIFTIWTDTEEVEPLIEYVKRSQGTIRPLEMAGFDMNITASHSADRFAADLRLYVAALREPVLRDQALKLAEQAAAAHERIYARVEARRRQYDEGAKSGKTGKALDDAVEDWEKREGRKLQPSPADVERLNKAVDGLLDMVRSHRSAFELVHGAREVAFMERAIENMRSSGSSMYDFLDAREHAKSDEADARSNKRWNRRDAQNASNLRWLIQEHYPGRKIIVWAHNAHVMNAYYAGDLQSIHIEQQPGDLKPMGVFLSDWLKEDVYSIAITAYEGEDGSVGTIARPPENSLESRLHRIGKPYLFLDFRTFGLHAPQSMRIDKYRDDVLSDVTKAFDAVFYIDRMVPASRIQRTAPSS